MNNPINILCTRALSDEYIDKAKTNLLQITCIPFISISYIIDSYKKEKIQSLLQQKITVIITSKNAIKSLVKHFHIHDIKSAIWDIYSIGYATKQKIQTYFKNSKIIDVAENVNLLTDKIIKHNNLTNIYFLGSNIRSLSWIEKLSLHNIHIEELLIYETHLQYISIDCNTYDGLIFYSPSAVRAFFKNNTIQDNIPIFAIGKITEAEIHKYGEYHVSIASVPTFGALLELIKNHFKIC